MESRNSLGTLAPLVVADKRYTFYSLKAAEEPLGSLAGLPLCARILLEFLLRAEDGSRIGVETMKALCAFYALPKITTLTAFRPARLLAHDESAVSMMTDLAALREEASNMGQAATSVAPMLPLDVVIERSRPGQVLGRERMELLRWSEKVFDNVSLIPPGKGTCTPVHIGSLASIVRQASQVDGALVYPDTALGTDPHMAALGALGALGWNVDTLDIEELSLGTPITLTLPRVIGVILSGKPRRGISATDIALALAKAMTPHTITGRVIEFSGTGLDHLSVPDRVCIANALTDAGALSVYFPIDQTTLGFLLETGHTPETVALTESYARAQSLWRDTGQGENPTIIYSQKIDIAIDAFRPGLGCLTGPQSHTPLIETATVFAKTYPPPPLPQPPLAPVRHGDIVWADLNASLHGGHAYDMVVAGLVARKARRLALTKKPWVQSSLTLATPFGRDILTASGLMEDLSLLGFRAEDDIAQRATLAPTLPETITATAARDKIALAAIASGPCEVLPQGVDLSVLAAPGLVVAYALAGNLGMDVTTKPLAQTPTGQDVFLKDLWPSAEEVTAVFAAYPMRTFYAKVQATLRDGGPEWDRIAAPDAQLYPWPAGSTYIRRPPTIPSHAPERAHIRNIADGRLLAVLGDNITTDQIAPQGLIQPDSLIGTTLIELGVLPNNLGTFGQRSGNYKVMVRGAWQGKGLVNKLAADHKAGTTFFAPTKEYVTYHEAARRYRAERKPLVLVAGANYGAGNNQEWAAKVARLLGAHAVLAESFDPAQRLALIRLGVLPLRLKQGITTESLALQPEDVISVYGLSEIVQLPAEALVTIEQAEGVNRYMVVCDLQEEREIAMVKNGGVWAQFIRDLIPLAV